MQDDIYVLLEEALYKVACLPRVHIHDMYPVGMCNINLSKVAKLQMFRVLKFMS